MPLIWIANITVMKVKDEFEIRSTERLVKDKLVFVSYSLRKLLEINQIFISVLQQNIQIKQKMAVKRCFNVDNTRSENV